MLRTLRRPLITFRVRAGWPAPSHPSDLFSAPRNLLTAFYAGLLAAAAKSLHLCLTLCDPIDSSPPNSPVPGILQARTLEWVAISFSNAWKWKLKLKSLSCVRLLATPWTAAHQAPQSMGFSRQEYWSGLPLPSPAGLLAVPQNRPAAPARGTHPRDSQGRPLPCV